VSLAVRQCFAEYALLEEGPEIVEAFNDEVLVHTGDDLADQTYLDVLAAMPALDASVRRIAGANASDGELAAAIEFVLEGLYLTKRLAKDASGARALYRARNR
jgi:magnesium chelatase subunit I